MNSMRKLMNMNIFVKDITLYLETIPVIINDFRLDSPPGLSSRSFKHSKFSSEVTVNGKLGVPPMPLALLFNTFNGDPRTTYDPIMVCGVRST